MSKWFASLYPTSSEADASVQKWQSGGMAEAAPTAQQRAAPLPATRPARAPLESDHHFDKAENDGEDPRMLMFEIPAARSPRYWSAANGTSGDADAVRAPADLPRAGGSFDWCTQDSPVLAPLGNGKAMQLSPEVSKWLREALWAERAEVQTLLEARHRRLLAGLVRGALEEEGPRKELKAAGSESKAADAARRSGTEKELSDAQEASPVTDALKETTVTDQTTDAPATTTSTVKKVYSKDEAATIQRVSAEVYKRMGLRMAGSHVKVQGDTPLQQWIHRYFLSHPSFDLLMGLMIVFNALLVGIEIQQSKDGNIAPWLKYAEEAFLIIFIIELTIRIVGYGKKSLQRPFLMFDFFLILIGVTASIGSQITDSEVIAALGGVTVARVLRLLRLTYGLRAVEWGVDFYKLATGLMNSVRTIVSAFVLILGAMYLFACVGVELCNSEKLKAHPETADIVDVHFGSVFKALLTLSQFINADSIAAIYNPLIRAEPWLAVYFMLGILVIAVSLMNLVTALIVDSAIRAASSDKEALDEEKKRTIEDLLPEIHDAFRMMDADKNGVLRHDELDSDEILEFLPEGLKEVIPADKLAEIFDTLGDTLEDSMGGTINELEFTWAVVTVAVGGIEFKQMMSYLRTITHQLKKVKKDHAALMAAAKLT